MTLLLENTFKFNLPFKTVELSSSNANVLLFSPGTFVRISKNFGMLQIKQKATIGKTIHFDDF